MKYTEIKNNVFYCGLDDKNRKYFDELIPLDNGTSYNSYLVKGSEKNALIDTMYAPKTEKYLRLLEKNNVNKIDYIIINHGEQDHSGALPELLKKYPESLIITNKICKNNLQEMLLLSSDRIKVVENQEEISLGNKTLRFIMTPNVHWPDTMFSYLIEDRLLFTCDFFGSHKILENLYSQEDKESEKSAKKYFAEIMLPFRNFCKIYLEQTKTLNPEMILPSHGPIYKNPNYILDLYEQWSSDECKNSILLPYVSMYKSTEEMIDYLIDKLQNQGIDCYKFNIIHDNLSDYITHLIDAKTIILGCSMILGNPHPAAYNIAYLLKLLKPKAKYLTIIGSYGWGGKLSTPLEEMMSNLDIEIISGVQIMGKAKENDYNELDKLINTIIQKHSNYSNN